MMPDEALREAIARDGRTRYAIARAAEVPPSNLIRFMAGGSSLMFNSGVRLARVVGLSLDRTEGPGDE